VTLDFSILGDSTQFLGVSDADGAATAPVDTSLCQPSKGKRLFERREDECFIPAEVELHGSAAPGSGIYL